MIGATATPSREWRLYGDGIVTITNNSPVFPTEPKDPNGKRLPGLYRLTLKNGYVYIGKACHLPNRFGNYRSPTQGTEQEHVLRCILLDAGGATVEVITGDELADDAVRDRQERHQIKAAIAANVLLLNTCGKGRRHYLEFRVKYYEAMLAEARTQLERFA